MKNIFNRYTEMPNSLLDLTVLEQMFSFHSYNKLFASFVITKKGCNLSVIY